MTNKSIDINIIAHEADAKGAMAVRKCAMDSVDHINLVFVHNSDWYSSAMCSVAVLLLSSVFQF